MQQFYKKMHFRRNIFILAKDFLIVSDGNLNALIAWRTSETGTWYLFRGVATLRIGAFGRFAQNLKKIELKIY